MSGVVAVLERAMVGNASSSLTPGSSMVSVAGKKRLPTISCALAAATDIAASEPASAAERHERLDMGNLLSR